MKSFMLTFQKAYKIRLFGSEKYQEISISCEQEERKYKGEMNYFKREMYIL